ncbi:MAG: hypothetical protein ACO3JL_16165, partial [Myxococcota bacterium]
MFRDVMCTCARLLAVVASVGGGLGAAGCSDNGENAHRGLPGGLVAVQPRVQLEGLVELSARSGGRLFVDEVALHAGSVRIQDGEHVLSDVLAGEQDAPGPLLFRYSLLESDAGELSAAERLWKLSVGGPESELVFGFSPFHPSPDMLDELRAHSGFDGALLRGHTAYLH